MILIAGAGLCGLSAAYHLGDKDYRIIERSDRPGGLCRTERRGPFSFDYGGHLLHLRDEHVKRLVRELLGDGLFHHRRRASIFSKGVFTPYPFQANTHGLPAEVVRDCLLGYFEAMLRSVASSSSPDNFHDWLLASFGRGFAKHFFLPFNQKFFKSDLTDMSYEWASWAIPRPSLREMVNGSLGLQESEFGYNIEFYYPAGGIEDLPRAFAGRLSRPIETGVELTQVFPTEHQAELSTGERALYNKLITSLPLDQLLSRLSGAPAEIVEASKRLRVLSVVCVNLGIEGPPLSDRHWIYFPEPEFPFHRIGFYSNAREIGPDKSALYLELTLPGPVGPEAENSIRELSEQAVSAFTGMPLFDGARQRIELVETMTIPHAYVVFDRFRAENLPRIFAYLREHDIEPVGRYGLWEYSTMEEAIRQGRLATLE